MANWLTFNKIAAWDYLFHLGFAYDDIPDEAIQAALDDPERLAKVDTSLDWEDDRWLAETPDIQEAQKHAYRIAALVRDFQAGELMEHAIWLDTYNVARCRSCVSNGHHRIRALQFLGLTAGPFALSGLLDPLEDLVRLAGCEPPREAMNYCVPTLLCTLADDIVL